MNRCHFHKNALALTLAACLTAGAVGAQRVQFSPAGLAIEKTMGGLRGMADSDRAVATKKLALDIRHLPASPEKVLLAEGLANLSTEGDFGRGTLQEVTTTLDQAVTEMPPAREQGMPSMAYDELAQLAKYEHMKVNQTSAEYALAVANLNKTDHARGLADFTLNDIEGHSWTLSSLKGKVVLVNFWATWCPPCRKEMPDLEELYNRFKDRGFVILAISDEDASKVNPFIAEHKYTYPVLLDPGRKVNTVYQVSGIPKSFIYDRKGRLAAQTIDMRTKDQFLALLAQAGLK